MELHIGNLIKEKTKEKYIKAAQLATMIDMKPQNLNAVFNRPSIDAELLLDISKALDFDFFSFYTKMYRASKGLEAPKNPADNFESKSIAELEQRIQQLEESLSNAQKTNEALLIAVSALESIRKNSTEREAELRKRIEVFEKKNSRKD